MLELLGKFLGQLLKEFVGIFLRHLLHSIWFNFVAILVRFYRKKIMEEFFRLSQKNFLSKYLEKSRVILRRIPKAVPIKCPGIFQRKSLANFLVKFLIDLLQKLLHEFIKKKLAIYGKLCLAYYVFGVPSTNPLSKRIKNSFQKI